MAVGSEIVVAEVPVATVIICTTIGYVIRALRQRGIELEKIISVLERRLAVVESDSPVTEGRLSRLETRVETVRTDLAVLASEVEGHERWHERNPTTHRPYPGR